MGDPIPAGGGWGRRRRRRRRRGKKKKFEWKSPKNETFPHLVHLSTNACLIQHPISSPPPLPLPSHHHPPLGQISDSINFKPAAWNQSIQFIFFIDIFDIYYINSPFSFLSLFPSFSKFLANKSSEGGRWVFPLNFLSNFLPPSNSYSPLSLPPLPFISCDFRDFPFGVCPIHLEKKNNTHSNNNKKAKKNASDNLQRNCRFSVVSTEITGKKNPNDKNIYFLKKNRPKIQPRWLLVRRGDNRWRKSD